MSKRPTFLEGLEILLNPLDLDQYEGPGGEVMTFDELYAKYFYGRTIRKMIVEVKEQVDAKVRAWHEVKMRKEADQQRMIAQPAEADGVPCVYLLREQVPGWVEQMEAAKEGSEWVLNARPEEIPYGLLVELDDTHPRGPIIAYVVPEVKDAKV